LSNISKVLHVVITRVIVVYSMFSSFPLVISHTVEVKLIFEIGYVESFGRLSRLA
jgi:hypothetical protein